MNRYNQKLQSHIHISKDYRPQEEEEKKKKEIIFKTVVLFLERLTKRHNEWSGEIGDG